MKKKYGLLAELLAKEDSFYVHCTECRSLLLISRDVIRDAVCICSRCGSKTILSSPNPAAEKKKSDTEVSL